MPYDDHFKIADDMIMHLDTFVNSINDDFITSRYIGFVAVSAVTVYELSIKQVFLDFSNKKHKVLGNFSEAYFNRLNGRIKLRNLKDEHIKRYGEKYLNRFERKLKRVEKDFLASDRISIMNCYSQLITYRHEFAHKGNSNINVTYPEITSYYQYGKEVIKCLAETMHR